MAETASTASTLPNAQNPVQEPARLVIDPAGRVVHASEGFARLCGCTAADLRGRAIDGLMRFSDPDDAFHSNGFFNTGAERSDAESMAQSLREGTHAVAIGQHVEQIQFDRVRLKDGRNYIIGLCGDAPLPTAEQVQDDLLKTLSLPVAGAPELHGPALEDSQHLLDLSHDLLCVSGPDGRIGKTNTTFNAVLGYDGTDLAGMVFLDLVHPDDKPQMRSALSGLMYEDAAQDTPIDCEARLIARNGGTHWMEWRHQRSGERVYSAGRDITAFKQNEQALRQREMMLREAQSIGHMGHWRWLVGANDIQLSDEIYKIFGVDRDGFRPTLENLNRMTHKRDVGRLLQAFQRAIIEHNTYDMEFRIIRPDGEVRYIRCEGRCEHDDQRDVIALFGIMQDVTERTMHERELTEAKDAAERAYAAKSQFLANMSHELRTPLNAIIGFSEMMQRQLLGPIGSERYLDYIGGIRESGEHLLDLISDILDMSKIEAGKYELDLEEINVAKVIRLAVHMMEGRATEAKIQVGLDIADEDQLIVADRRAVMQILLNLLSNAVKFTEPGGTVDIDCRSHGDDTVTIRVRDTGIGIPAMQLKNITRPFEQAASHYTRKHEGTGLGLAITKELIELHGGTLEIESTVGVGTTVTVHLPHNAYEALKGVRG